VLEITLTGVTPDGDSRARVDRVVVGQTELMEIELLSWTTSCGYSVADAPLGSRYLLFARLNRGERDGIVLFVCADNYNIYRLNDAGTEIRYGYTTARSGDQNAGLRFQPYSAEALRNICRQVSSPLDELRLSNNPGNGRTALSVTTGKFPELRELEVFRADGRRLTTLSLTEYTAGTPLPLGDLPNGYHILRITDGIHRKSLALSSFKGL
jgi:hypothetical protein